VRCKQINTGAKLASVEGAPTTSFEWENHMDRYTKVVLTVIAFSLLWISIQAGAFISNATAAYGATQIEIADVSVSKHRVLPVYVTGELKCIK